MVCLPPFFLNLHVQTLSLISSPLLINVSLNCFFFCQPEGPIKLFCRFYPFDFVFCETPFVSPSPPTCFWNWYFLKQSRPVASEATCVKTFESFEHISWASPPFIGPNLSKYQVSNDLHDFTIPCWSSPNVVMLCCSVLAASQKCSVACLNAKHLMWKADDGESIKSPNLSNETKS